MLNWLLKKKGFKVDNEQYFIRGTKVFFKQQVQILGLCLLLTAKSLHNSILLYTRIDSITGLVIKKLAQDRDV